MAKENNPTPLTITQEANLSQAIDQLNLCAGTLTLIVVDKNNKVVGTLTDGDIRRWLSPSNEYSTHNGIVNFNEVLVKDLMHREPIVIKKQDDSWFDKITEARKLEEERNVHIRLIPIINKHGELEDVLDLFVSKQRTRLEVILMAKACLEDISQSMDKGNYTPCVTYESVLMRRCRYDTIRYSHEREKYAALVEVIEKEFDAIKKHRRLDELFTALNRGQDWARASRPPNKILQGKLNKLTNDLERAKKDLLISYIKDTRGKDFIGRHEAAEEPDVIFVLGCVKQNEQAKRTEACNEFLKTLIDNQEKLPKAIVLSGGGSNSKTTEAEQMNEVLEKTADIISVFLKSGGKILKEEDSLDTVGNAIFGQLTLIGENLYSPDFPANFEDTDSKRICIFTSDYHAHRTLGLFQRVFHNALVSVRYVRAESNLNLEDLADLAIRQLDSEARANSETFSLKNAVTGMSTSITEGHIQSVFFQLMRHHDMYKWRSDLIRKYAKILNELSRVEEL